MLLEAWTGWHSVAPPMRDEYQRLVELANEGARELGYKDTGALWRSKYDMEPDAFAAELDRLWGQVKPLYESLHCYVRAEAQREVRRPGRAARRAHPGAPAGQHVGAGAGATSMTWSRRRRPIRATT